MNPLNIVGQKFNKLLCVERAENVGRAAGFVFKCDCGRLVLLSGSAVKSGDRKSCGDKIHRLKTSHLRNHPLYDVWKGMKARCRDKNHVGYKIYGGRGVKVCEEWAKDFISFYNWCMANGWEHGMDIDKDIKGNGLLYSPETCSIITGVENSRATRATKLDYDKVKEIRESTLPYKELAKKYGVHLSSIQRVKSHKSW